MKWLSYLRSGEYFTVNWQALTSNTAKNISLTTEGGYIFTLWISSFIHKDLPFFVSSLFLTCMLFSLSLVVTILDKSFKRGILVSLISMIYIFSFPDITQELMTLNLCLRDGLAHFLGFSGLLLCCIGIKKIYNKKYILAGSIFIGLSSWCRVPDILFIVPVGIYALCYLNKKNIKSFFYGLTTIFTGLLIGLLPLFLQNTFEGKAFYQAGQSAVLAGNILEANDSDNRDIEKYQLTYGVLTTYSENAKEEEFIGTEKGLSFANFSSVSKAMARTMFRGMKGINIYILLLCILISLLINFKSSITLLGGFFAFFLFYSFYDKVIIRYILICFLMLIPIISTVIADLLLKISASLSNLKDKHSTYYQVLSALLVIILIYKISPYYKGFNDIKNSRLYYQKNIDAIDLLNLKDGDYFMCSDKSHKIWTQYSSGAKSFSWQWSAAPHFDVLPTNMQQLREIKNAINNGSRIFFFEIEGGLYPYKYWSRLDMSLHYDLEEKMRIEKATPLGENIIIYKLCKKNRQKLDLNIPNTEEINHSSKLFIWADDASETVPYEQHVIISSGTKVFTNSLHCGFNLYQLPKDFLDYDNRVTIKSNTNLPTIISTSIFSTNIIINLQDYDKMGATVRTIKGSTPIFFDNIYSWAREIKPPNGEYRQPEIAIGQSAELNIYNGLSENINLNFNISTVAKLRTRYIFELLKDIKFTYNNEEVRQDIKRTKWVRVDNSRYLNLQITHYNIKNNTNYNILGDFSNCNSNIPVFLDSIEFQITND